jgi:hypothetical protein
MTIDHRLNKQTKHVKNISNNKDIKKSHLLFFFTSRKKMIMSVDLLTKDKRRKTEYVR